MSLVSLEVARAVANDPLTVPELLKELALHEDMQVRRAIASNPNTPSYVLFQLAKEFPEEFFNNPVFPLLSLENPDFYQAIPEKTLQSLLVHKSVPDTWLDWALTRMSTNLSMSLVTNPATSRAVLEKIDKYVDSMRGLVQMHVNYSGEMTSGWHEFFNDKFKSWQNQSEYAELEILLLLELGIISESQFMQLPTKVKQNILKQTNSPQLIEAVLVSKPHKILRLECARNFFTPTQELIKLAFDNDNEVRESAMCNPNIPREIVEEYYRQHMISNHPNSRSDELSELIFSKWWFIRANAAKHFNLSLDDLEKFLCDSDFNVRASAAKNPNISIKALEKLAKDKNARVRAVVAQNLKTPIQCLEKLLRDRNEEVRASVAFNSNISLELNASLAVEFNPDLLKKYSKNKLSSSDKYDIAVNAATPLNELISIYTKTQSDKCEIHFEAMKNICQQLMWNQYITVELLTVLLDKLLHPSRNINICTIVACHKNADYGICRRFIKSYSTEIRFSLTKNPNISIKLLEELLQDNDVGVRISALQAYQKRYANSDNTSNFLIEWETATHLNTPPEKLVELVKSEWILVREAVAMHPCAAEAFIVTKDKKAAITVLEKLAQDECKVVKIAVAKNPKTSIKTLEAIIAANNYNRELYGIVALKNLLERAPERAEKHLLYYHKNISYSLLPFILQHPAAPITLLKNKLHSSSWMERYAITQNPKISCEILEVLAKDANRVVRAAAKERLGNIAVMHDL